MAALPIDRADQSQRPGNAEELRWCNECPARAAGSAVPGGDGAAGTTWPRLSPAPQRFALADTSLCNPLAGVSTTTVVESRRQNGAASRLSDRQLASTS